MPPDDPRLLGPLEKLTDLYVKAGKPDKAVKVFSRMLVIVSSKHDKSSLALADANLKLAGLYAAAGDRVKSKALLDKCWKTYAIANVKLKEKDPVQAENMIRKWLATASKVEGAENWRYAAMLRELAACYLRANKYDQQEKLFDEIIERSKDTKPAPDEPADRPLAWAEIDLARIYEMRSKLPQAEQLATAGLTSMRQRVPAHHSSLAIALSALAEIELCAGKYSVAEQHYKQSMQILQDDPGRLEVLLRSWQGLAHCCIQQGKCLTALSLVNKSIELREQLPDSKKAMYIPGSVTQLAACYNCLGQYDKAAAVYERSLLLITKLPAQLNPAKAAVMQAYATSLRKIGRTQEAQAAETEAAKLRTPSGIEERKQ